MSSFELFAFSFPATAHIVLPIPSCLSNTSELGASPGGVADEGSLLEGYPMRFKRITPLRSAHPHHICRRLTPAAFLRAPQALAHVQRHWGSRQLLHPRPLSH